MKDFTLKFRDREGYKAFLNEINWEDNEVFAKINS